MDLRFSKKKYGSKVEPSKMLVFQGRMAATLIEKWGIVAGYSDGEDSAGRAKMKLMDPKDIVERAVEVAKIATKALESEGWFFDIPEDTEI